MRRENRGPSASACTPPGYQHRGGGFPGEAVPAPGHPRTRGRPLLLLFAADHPPQAVPRPCCARAELGQNSYRNLVSCCLDCNSLKAERNAVEFVRWLYRERRLSDAELSGRLRALDDLAAGKLVPPLTGLEAGTQRKARTL